MKRVILEENKITVYINEVQESNYYCFKGESGLCLLVHHDGYYYFKDLVSPYWSRKFYKDPCIKGCIEKTIKNKHEVLEFRYLDELFEWSIKQL